MFVRAAGGRSAVTNSCTGVATRSKFSRRIWTPRRPACSSACECRGRPEPGTSSSLYTPLLYRWARGRGLQEADAGDLVQDVLTVLVRSLPKFRYDPNKRFRAWLHTVTLNCWRNRDAVVPSNRWNKARPSLPPLQTTPRSSPRRNTVDILCGERRADAGRISPGNLESLLGKRRGWQTCGTGRRKSWACHRAPFTSPDRASLPVCGKNCVT